MDGLLKQIAKFATIGVGATFIHVAAALLFNSFAKFSALQSNFLAFLVASAFTYCGNYFWTFAKTGAVSSTLIRFIFLSLSCFAVNQTIVYIVTSLMQLPLWIAMIPVVAVIPAFSFWVSKKRVFILPTP
jgi:putative flippase GtrA